MNKVQAISNVEFSDEDRNEIRNISNLFNDHADEVVDAVLSVIGNDKRVLNILKEDGITADDAKKAWIGALKMLFSEPMDDVMFDKMFKIGIVHVDKGVNEELVIEAMNLMMIKTLEVLSKYVQIENKLYLSIVKLFAVALSAMIASYSEEQERRKDSLLKSLGISGNLLKRLVTTSGI